MRGSGRPRLILSAAVLAMAMAIPGLVPGSIDPVLADCGMQAPPRSIGAYTGFAFDGVIMRMDVHQEPGSGWLIRVTMDGTSLTGDAVAELVFDLEPGGECSWLQGERYKVGDRLVLSASAAPSVRGAGEPDIRTFARVLTWRHEWADQWTLHGLRPEMERHLPREIRAASTRDGILMLVAPDALPFTIDDAAWRVAANGRGRDTLLEAVAWRGGFVALGQRVGRRGRDVTPAIWRSADGGRWELETDALSPRLLDGAEPMELVTFRDQLFLAGAEGGTLVIWRSADGVRWERILEAPYRDDPPTMDGGTLLPIGAITAAADDARFVVLAHNEGLPGPADRRVVWTSTDGASFTRADTTGLPRSPGRMLSTGDGFMVPLDDGTTWTSTDGVAWEAGKSLPPGWADLASGATGDRIVVAMNAGMTSDHTPPVPGPIHARVAERRGGGAWTPMVDGPGESGWASAVDAVGARIAVLGDHAGRPWVLTSMDGGATWTYGALPGVRGDACPVDIVVGARSTIVIGGCGGPLAWVADR